MKILSELDKKVLMQIKIMDLYNNGHTYKEIALLTKKTESSVKKIVNTWINKMPLDSQNLIRKNHKINTLDKKKLNKVLKYELKKIMGDKDFVSRNPSIYKTSITGEITLKKPKEIGCSTTWDTPRKLKIKN
ncbi:DNA-binding response regulator [Clostridium perfringens]|uniref:DNA-binding response regulator n=1 Tax=Clostridium perfringens TaxID=1502 RepID=UPI003F43D650